jgi:hypothetical protein
MQCFDPEGDMILCTGLAHNSCDGAFSASDTPCGADPREGVLATARPWIVRAERKQRYGTTHGGLRQAESTNPVDLNNDHDRAA